MQYAVGNEACEDIVPDEGIKTFIDHLRKEFPEVQVSLGCYLRFGSVF
jgi:hypothetical protein